MSRSRLLRTSLRTVHLIAFGAFYGGHVFNLDSEMLFPALIGVVGSGAAFLIFEVWCAPIFLIQVRGLANLAKVALLLSTHWFWDYRIAILTAIVIISSLVSHMPSGIRYYTPFGGEVRDAGRG